MNTDTKAQAQHSPLPWRLRYRKGLAIIDGEYFDIAQMERSGSAATEYEANAKLIVRAVNNAEKLAEALRDLANSPNDLHYRIVAIDRLKAYEGAQS